MAKHITPAALVVDRFGSCKKVALAINAHCGAMLRKPIAPSTIGRWVHSHYIPGRWASLVLLAAKAEGIELTPDDLIYGGTKGELK